MQYSKTVKADKFYTKKEVAKKLISMLPLGKYDTVIEPSAGNGSFSKLMKCVAYDLYPENDDIIKQDWFEYEPTQNLGSIAVVGNPPFGIRNALAKKFIQKSIDIGADLIAFVLTDTFRKPTYDNVAKGYKLTKVIQLRENSFMVDREEHHIPCSFFVWEKDSDKQDLTWKRGTYTTSDFEFVYEKDYNKSTDIRVKQAISKEMIDPVKGKCHYIRPAKRMGRVVRNTLENLDFKGYSAVNGGVIALSREEIIANYLKGVVI